MFHKKTHPDIVCLDETLDSENYFSFLEGEDIFYALTITGLLMTNISTQLLIVKQNATKY